MDLCKAGRLRELVREEVHNVMAKEDALREEAMRYVNISTTQQRERR